MQVSRAPAARATPNWQRGARLGCLQAHKLARRCDLVRTRATKDDGNDLVSGAIKAASGLVDKATDLVPESVPRSAAKAGVTIAGGMFVFWMLQKLISGVLTLALFAGVGYYFITKNSDSDDSIDVTPSNSSKGKSGDNLDDPLAEARRIMDKYK